MEQEKKSNGALVGSIIIITILIIGGIYIWQTKMKELKVEKQRQEEMIKENNAELDQIEKDLNNISTTEDVDVSKIQ